MGSKLLIRAEMNWLSKTEGGDLVRQTIEMHTLSTSCRRRQLSRSGGSRCPAGTHRRMVSRSTRKVRCDWVMALLAVVGLCLTLFGCGESGITVDSATTSTSSIPDEQQVEFFQIQEGDLWGFMDRSGTVVIAPQFAWVGDFAYGLAPVETTGDSSGYVDARGQTVMEGRFELTWSFSEGLAPVYRDGLYGYIDTTGTVAFELECAHAGGFSDGLAPIETSEGWGFIDRTGRFVLEPQYGDTIGFREGLAGVEMPAGVGFIDKTGEFVIEPHLLGAEEFGDGLAASWVPWPGAPSGKWGYVDRTGEFVIPPQFDGAYTFGDGLAPARIEADEDGIPTGPWGYIDATGTFVLQPQYYVAAPFRGGLAFVITLEGKNAYIDTTGAIVWESEQVSQDYLNETTATMPTEP